MFENNHGVNLRSMRVCELVKLEKELLKLDELIEETVSLVDAFDSLGVSNIVLNIALTELKEFKEYGKLRLKYLKQDEFNELLSLSKDCTILYVKTANTPKGNSPRISIPSALTEIYLRDLIETNLIYLFIENTEMCKFVNPSIKSAVCKLITRINCLLITLKNKEK